MPSILLTGPAVEPLSLDEAKDYLRVEHADDDVLIAALITAARDLVEVATRRALITQTWRHKHDAWPCDGRIALLPAPLQSLAAVRVYDKEGVAQAVGLQAFVVDTIAVPGVVWFTPWSVPAPGRRYGGIELDIVTGYGDAAADVPTALKLAIRLLLAHWYENRGVVLRGGAAPMPASFPELIGAYRVLSL